MEYNNIHFRYQNLFNISPKKLRNDGHTLTLVNIYSIFIITCIKISEYVLYHITCSVFSLQHSIQFDDINDLLNHIHTAIHIFEWI